MKIVILAGGGGTRLFPLSRLNYPKQFISIGSSSTLLAQTVNRFNNCVNPEDILIVTNEKYYFLVKDELTKYNKENVHIITEPYPRNTMPAIVLALKFITDVIGSSEDEEVFVAPADHIIEPAEQFNEKLQECIMAARERKISTLGIIPNKPETGYGYIKAGKQWKYGYEVENFVEKPDKQTAENYLLQGGYYWNSGMFAFTIRTFYEELKAYENDLYKIVYNNSYNYIVKCFKDLKSISIDYAIAERSKRVITIPMGIYWNDVGSWDSIYDYLPKDQNGNIISGDCEILDCEDSLLISKERLVTGVGLSNIMVVETDDVIMVAKKGESQKVKQLVEKLSGRVESTDHSTVSRPWGCYRILSQSRGYKVKKITVNPGKKLSLQLHHYRSEHWIVINGRASVIIGGDDQRLIRKNESIYVPKETKHRLMNLECDPLEIIEVQNGDYLGEDDIERFDDVFDRR